MAEVITRLRITLELDIAHNDSVTIEELGKQLRQLEDGSEFFDDAPREFGWFASAETSNALERVLKGHALHVEAAPLDARVV